MMETGCFKCLCY